MDVKERAGRLGTERKRCQGRVQCGTCRCYDPLCDCCRSPRRARRVRPGEPCECWEAEGKHACRL